MFNHRYPFKHNFEEDWLSVNWTLNKPVNLSDVLKKIKKYLKVILWLELVNIEVRKGFIRRFYGIS